MINLHYSFKEIATMAGGVAYIHSPSNDIVSDIIIDSRKLISVEGCMFVALQSGRNDGHKYLEELYKAGIRLFLVEKKPELEWVNNANFIVVENTLKALQKISAHHRKKFNLNVIGITGSNGKTIVKEWIYTCLEHIFSVVRSPKSYNSQIGVPLSILQITDHHEIGIFEAGISEPEEMDNLAKIIQPDIGIFLNIGTAHDENFINTNQKINEKLQLFKKAKTLIYCNDHSDIKTCILTAEVFKSVNCISWSKKSKDANLYLYSMDIKEHSTLIKGIFQQKTELAIEIPFIDQASIENALHVWLLLLHLKIDNNSISHSFLQLGHIAMRLELKEGINHCSIINDSYSSDLSSLNIAIDFLNQQAQNDNKTVILSDIFQSGLTEPELYSEVSRLLREKGVNQIIGIGKAIAKQQALFSMSKHFYETTRDFIMYHPLSTFQNETILIKGARSFEFEQINKILQQKAHETVMEIDLNNMLENLNFYRKEIGKNVKVMAMVKAFSYGSGGFEVANMLQFNQVDYLTVAYADEGVELRKAGITMPIMVMNPEFDSFDLMIHHNLEPEIYSFRVLEMLEKTLDQEMLSQHESIGIHIKIDSGMHRLGFLPNDMNLLIKKLKQNGNVRIKSIFSHLAAADDSNFDDFTRNQIKIFDNCSKKICDEFDYFILRHISNSVGIHRFPEARFDMVRLGIGLYGISSENEIQRKLKNVSSLKTRISQIKEIEIGDSVGYSRKYIADKRTTVGIIPIGYADGLSRLLSNGKGKMLVNGKYAPIIGNVCMDMCMLDVTNLDVHEGDEVIVFSSFQSICEIANTTQTIPYEVLTSVSRRVKRVYFQD